MRGDDRRAQVGAARRQLRTSSSASRRAPDDFARVALPEHDGDVLRDLLVSERARVVIEIGLAYGSSALAIAEALADVEGAHHVAIDAHQEEFDDAGWNALVSAGVEATTTLLRERSQLALAQLIGDGFVADAAFVDGSHLFHNVFVDLASLRELVRPGGIVILDDCHWPSVATAVRYFERNLGWAREPIAGENRLRAYRLPDPPAQPSFEAFVPFGSEASPDS